ncbi:Carboxylesterase NlhH [Anatilimnocola aggregata]|uniref:Carboxylesterase NlhH n=1 Tax=Anatilimnocola aggregata TaxID=2528021 RepID=A0A517Y6B1_9BACT|nr:alpha/beta hydrolase [Anatilimnocola aggregata]QDU25756.1 Carboxylesterase NlhH [Anatilimnocola aggregata]
MRTIGLFAAFVAFLFYPAIVPDASAQKGAPQRAKPPQGFVAEYDVKYVPNGDEAQALDIYYPETATDKPQPLLIWIHGGGWSGGSKAGIPYLSQLPRGYVVASIEYRFSQKAPFPAQIQDCQAAIRFLRANAKKYSIDPERIGVGGASAGGHLAALVGTSGGKKAFPMIGGNEDQSDRVQAVCDIFGPTNFWTVVTQAEEDKNVKNIFKWNSGDPYSRLIAAKLGEDKAKCDAVSPVHYVSKDNPPFLILHGDHDTLVPYAQSVELKELLDKSGVEATLQKLPGAGHGGASFALPALAKLTVSFFDKHLKGIDAKIEALPESEVTVKAASPAKK